MKNNVFIRAIEIHLKMFYFFSFHSDVSIVHEQKLRNEIEYEVYAIGFMHTLRIKQKFQEKKTTTTAAATCII